ncbi:NADH:flavin oxidoreductase/NADH oxidase [Pseudohoeflea sp. DP4N28-3]|uniref:NADH:flavin oxidoreductase/NADH oxidase n=1 Tax=Pseudohoeflea coraliihabitans TaxID=2860393 RepID=A0ABS6WND0_9HYPH|nr:NADH:flavin oxidoreductase/NADH oxidase [Pseudohoeflea sp. DP4N28-3]MBW3097471.1 NADH:flavin oxidoreductase/NADH oxidase [Pseudohoeflea sp. DP4N28-3]
MPTSLFSPLRLKKLELENRIVVSPMCQYSAEDGSATDWHLQHLGTLSASGAGLLVVEATAVSAEGRISHGDLGLYSDANEQALGRVVAHCRAHGDARLGIQIGHAGRKASAQRPWEGGGPLGSDEQPWETIAPSAQPFADGWHTPRAMTSADLDRIRDAHVSAARRALRLGFDALEVHAAHGYLMHEFFSPIANHREDEFGGSLAARMRYPLLVIKAVREVWPDDRPLGVRITGRDWVDGGITLEDACAFAVQLKAVGVDFVCVSSGGISATARPEVFPGYQLAMAEAVRQASGLATRAVGLIATPQQAEEAVSSGQADMVALGRAFLDNPHWGWLAARALGAEVARPVQYQRAAPAVWPGADFGNS